MKYIIDSIKKEQAYHHTGIMMLIKCINDIYGKVQVSVGNSLNQGFFVYFGDTDRPLTQSEVTKIREKMNRLVQADVPVNKEIITCGEAVELWHRNGFSERARLYSPADPDTPVAVYELDGYRDFFYSDMLPSTGYYELFDLRGYKNGLLLRHPCVPHPDSIPEYRDDDKLYDAFADSKRMRKSLKLDYLADLNDKNEDELREVISGSERIQNKEIAAIAERIVNDGRRIVMIAGPSSSGKTTFAKKLCDRIGKLTSVEPIYIGTDDYFVEREQSPRDANGEYNYEGLDAIDLDLFNNQMSDLLNGREIDAPEFDFLVGKKRFGKRFIKAKENQIIVIEGIHSLNDELTRDIPSAKKFKVYISPLTRIGIDRHNRLSTADARLLRRIVRDNSHRGRDAAGTIKDWTKVRNGETGNVFPYSSMADVVFNTSLVYETSVLKHFAKPLLEKITPEEPEYEEAGRLLDFIVCFREIDLVDAIPEDSILREFID